MSGLITAAAATVIATAATIATASLFDVQSLLAPLVEGNEFTVVSVSILATIPVLGAMTVLVATGRE